MQKIVAWDTKTVVYIKGLFRWELFVDFFSFLVFNLGNVLYGTLAEILSANFAVYTGRPVTKYKYKNTHHLTFFFLITLFLRAKETFKDIMSTVGGMETLLCSPAAIFLVKLRGLNSSAKEGNGEREREREREGINELINFILRG